MKILDPSVVNEMFAGVEDILERHRMFGNALDSGIEIELFLTKIMLFTFIPMFFHVFPLILPYTLKLQ